MANNYPEMDVLVEVSAPKSGHDWMPREELRTILNARTRYPTIWIKNPETKYLNFRWDCRTGHALIWTQGFNSINMVNREEQRKKLIDRLRTSLAIGKHAEPLAEEVAQFLENMTEDVLGVEEKKYWRLNPNWKDPIPVTETPVESARQFARGEISAGKLGEVLGLGPGELHDFKNACAKVYGEP